MGVVFFSLNALISSEVGLSVSIKGRRERVSATTFYFPLM